MEHDGANDPIMKTLAFCGTLCRQTLINTSRFSFIKISDPANTAMKSVQSELRAREAPEVDVTSSASLLSANWLQFRTTKI